MKNAYQKLLDDEQLCFDQAQVTAIDALTELSKQLVTHQKYRTYLSRSTSQSPQGLYLHGRVGRGKTMLMDLFYENLTIKKKKRIHFHHFIESIHQQLAKLSGLNDPLIRIAESWAKEFHLLCFDELFVNDIGDAMLLSGLFSALFDQGITLVATSNCKPEQLYCNGLQRERFLPTISLLNQYCQVISIDGEVDHRLGQSLTSADGHYQNYFIMGKQGNDQLIKRFKLLTQVGSFNAGTIKVNHRDIAYLAKEKSTIYFDFFALCSGPRSQRDYMQLAQQFLVVFISNIPQFSGSLIPAVFSGVEDSYQRSGVLMGELRQLDDEARRFIALVDEFYDQGVKLVVSAEADITKLYQGEQLAFEFARCQSRLFEMQKSIVGTNH